MNLKTNGNSVMPKARQSQMIKNTPRQYAGAYGSMKVTPAQVASYHVSKGKNLGTTKGKKAPVPNPTFRTANTPGSTASNSRTSKKK